MADKAIADSKKVLASAEKFRPTPKPTSPAPSKNTMKVKSPSTGLLGDQGADSAAGVKANADNVDAYVKGVPKMHKGGEVMEDGLKNLKKGEVVISKEKAEEGKKIMGLMNKAKDEMDNEPKEKSEGKKKTSDKHNPAHETKKEEKKEDKKPAKKAGKKVKGMHVRRATSGGFIVKHDMDNSAGAGAPQGEPEEHAIPDMASLQSHMQDHMGDEEAPSAGAPAAAAPAAEEAPAQS